MFYQNFLAVSLAHVEDVSKTCAGTCFPPTELNIAAFSAMMKHLAKPWAAISSRSLSHAASAVGTAVGICVQSASGLTALRRGPPSTYHSRLGSLSGLVVLLVEGRLLENLSFACSLFAMLICLPQARRVRSMAGTQLNPRPGWPFVIRPMSELPTFICLRRLTYNAECFLRKGKREEMGGRKRAQVFLIKSLGRFRGITHRF